MTDMLSGFSRYDFRNADIAHDVYQIGAGPPVLVMHELPGFAQPAVNFARRLADAGFQVHLPHLFGEVGVRDARRYYKQLCVSREFANLAAGVSAPITDWLRALARHISERNGNRQVGAIGMCLTGAFVIPLVIDPWVSAPVAAQPAVPFSVLYLATGLGYGPWARELNVTNDQVNAAASRLRAEDRKLLALRFAEDRICPRGRFERLAEEFGAQLEAHEYGGASLWQQTVSPRHAVLTEQYDNESDSDHATRHAFRRVCEFLRENLARAPAS
jgi:dienelactone hydrolase